MSLPTNQVFFTQRFIRELRAVKAWLDINAATGIGKGFVIELDEYIRTRIAAHPTRFMEWPWKRTQQKLYRRAIFKKKYVIVFKYWGNWVELILIYHQKRNPKNIKI